jgi:hypothetical protein
MRESSNIFPALAGTLQLRDDRGFNAHGTGIHAGKKLRLQAGGR